VCILPAGGNVQYRKINERHFARYLILGRLTAQDSDGVRDLIAEIKRGADRRYLIDLTGLDFIDSSGIGMLLVINGETLGAGKALGMVVGQGQVQRVVTLTRIGMIIPAFESLDAYVAACVPEALLSRAPCAPGEDPVALAVRSLMAGAA